MHIYNKAPISHPYLYIVHFTKPEFNRSIVFIHGGPGFNCGIIEFLIEHEDLFEALQYNIIVYDQQGCGRSKRQKQTINHQDNINDLHELALYLEKNNIIIAGLVGHSYGAKLLLDFYHYTHSKIPAVFVGIADSMLKPRLNNLMSDLIYLKKTDEAQYAQVLSLFKENLSLNELWQITEDIAHIFQKNQDRAYQLWANMECMKKYQDIQNKINIKVSQDVMMSVRKDIYTDKDKCGVDILSLPVPYLWINGFHDYAMGTITNFVDNDEMILFYKSGHYPHIEENKLFSDRLNDFLKIADVNDI